MPTQPLYDLHKVLDLLSRGSQYAFAQVFDHYRNTIYSTALKYLKSPVLAEEVVQDVFLRLWLKRADVVKVQRFDAWLFIIARNTIFDRLKKLSYETAAYKELANNVYFADDADHRLRDHQCQSFLQDAINQLSPQQKQAYILTKVEGLSYREAGKRLNISELTVKVHMTKALSAIRDYLTTHMQSFIFIHIAAKILLD